MYHLASRLVLGTFACKFTSLIFSVTRQPGHLFSPSTISRSVVSLSLFECLQLTGGADCCDVCGAVISTLLEMARLLVDVDASTGVCSCIIWCSFPLETARLALLPDDLLKACTATSSMRAMAATTPALYALFGNYVRRAAVRVQAHIRRVVACIHTIKLQSSLVWPLNETTCIDRWIEDHPAPFYTGCSQIYASPGIEVHLSRRELVASLIMAIQKDQQIYERRVVLQARRDEISVDSFLHELRVRGFEYYDPEFSVWESPISLIEGCYLRPEDRPIHWPPVHISYVDKPSRGVLRTQILINALPRYVLEVFYLDRSHDPRWDTDLLEDASRT